MCLDRRFPWLCRIQNAPLDTSERVSAVRFADAVARRTGTEYVWNSNSGGVFFHYGSIDRPAFEFPFKPVGERTYRVTDSDVDDVVRFIQMGKLPAETKDRIARENQVAEKNAKEQEQGRELDRRRKSAEDHAAFLERRRRGVQKIIAKV